MPAGTGHHAPDALPSAPLRRRGIRLATRAHPARQRIASDQTRTVEAWLGAGEFACLRCQGLVVTSGCFILIYGIAAVASSHMFTAGAHDVSGSLNSWSWITLIIGVLRLLAAAGC
jgi:hypothetical protein